MLPSIGAVSFSRQWHQVHSFIFFLFRFPLTFSRDSLYCHIPYPFNVNAEFGAWHFLIGRSSATTKTNRENRKDMFCCLLRRRTLQEKLRVFAKSRIVESESDSVFQDANCHCLAHIKCFMFRILPVDEASAYHVEGSAEHAVRWGDHTRNDSSHSCELSARDRHRLNELKKISGAPPKWSISLSERNLRKVNQPVFSFWIVVTIVLRNSFESLHPVLKHVLQRWSRDGANDFMNCCK
jgi:hypothetical protein